MKKVIILILVGFLITSCQSQPDYFTVSGVLTNGSGEKIYFSELQANKINILDSLILDSDGVFSFKGTTDVAKFYALRTNPRN